MAECDLNPRSLRIGGHVVSPHHRHQERHLATDIDGDDVPYPSPLFVECGLTSTGAAAGRRRNQSRGNGSANGEWVTLSKSLLLQLVERICHLSFQTSAAAATTAASSSYPEPGSVPEAVNRTSKSSDSTPDAAMDAEEDQRTETSTAEDANVAVMDFGETVAVVVGNGGEERAGNDENDSMVGGDVASVEKRESESASCEKAATNEDRVAVEHKAATVDVISSGYVLPGLSAVATVEKDDETPSTQQAIRRKSADTGSETVPASLSPGCVHALVGRSAEPVVETSPQSDRGVAHAEVGRPAVDGVVNVVSRGGNELPQTKRCVFDQMLPPVAWPATLTASRSSSCPGGGRKSAGGCAAVPCRRVTVESVPVSKDVSVESLAQRRHIIRARRRHSGETIETLRQQRRSMGDDITTDDAMRLERFAYRRSTATGVVGQQPWMALNKSIVYRVLDVVLSQSAAASVQTGSDDVFFAQSSLSPASSSLKRPNKNRIWNPAISSSPERDPRLEYADRKSHFSCQAAIRFGHKSPTPGRGIPDELRSSISELVGSVPSILRKLLDENGADVPLPVPVRRRSETTTTETSKTAASVLDFASNSRKPPSFPHDSRDATASPGATCLYGRRRHRSADRENEPDIGAPTASLPGEWLVCAARHSRLLSAAAAACDGGLDQTLMFVDDAHGRDLLNYFRSQQHQPQGDGDGGRGFPVILSDISGRCTTLADDINVVQSPDRKRSPPEVGLLPPTGVAPRWVALNKGDVSTLFESLATAMMDSDAVSSSSSAQSAVRITRHASMSAMTPEVDRAWCDASSPEVATGSQLPRRLRTRLEGSSVDSVFRRPMPASPANQPAGAVGGREPVKWKSSLMRRMQCEVETAEHEMDDVIVSRDTVT